MRLKKRRCRAPGLLKSKYERKEAYYRIYHYNSRVNRLGQHFLTNADVLRKIARIIVRDGGPIIEIGPGHGELTKILLASPDIPRLIAIERDPALATALEKTFETESRFTLIRGDALHALPEAISLLDEQYTIAGNIPYYITGHLLRTIGELPRRPARTVLLIQKEVAERIVARPPHMNRLAAAVQFWAIPKIVGHVGRHDFRPPPKVDSTVIELTTIVRKADSRAHDRVLHALFAQPRKTILNNLGAKGTGLAKGELPLRLAALGINPGDRPQNLSVEQVALLASLWDNATVRVY